MKIINFDVKYLDEMAQLFVQIYSHPKYEWDLQTAKNYILRNTSEYSMIAVDDYDQYLGSISATVYPYHKGLMLFIDNLQVKNEHRQRGVAKQLLNQLLDLAKSKGVTKVHFLANDNNDFSTSWYNKLGFKKNRIEFEADLENISID